MSMLGSPVSYIDPTHKSFQFLCAYLARYHSDGEKPCILKTCIFGDPEKSPRGNKPKRKKTQEVRLGLFPLGRTIFLRGGAKYFERWGVKY